jgi:hypothetical protein
MSVALRSLRRMLALNHRLPRHRLQAITTITMIMVIPTGTDTVTVTVDMQCPEHVHHLKNAQCRTIPVRGPLGVIANHLTLCYP